VLLVLWDIDGTLVDAVGHGARAFEDAYEAVLGEPFRGSVPFAGHTDRQIARAMLDGSTEHLPRLLEELVPALEARRELIRAEGRPHEGAAAALAALAAEDGLVQSLLTGNVETNAALKVSAFGLERGLDLEVGGYGSDPHEARSDLVQIARSRARNKYGEPVDVVLVGDTPLDVGAAREAGVRVVAIADASYGVDELTDAGADAVLPDLRDTEALVAAVTRR